MAKKSFLPKSYNGLPTPTDGVDAIVDYNTGMCRYRMLSVLLLLPSCGTQSSLSSSDASSGQSTWEEAGMVACDSAATHSSVATYYLEADGSGNCVFDSNPNNPLVAALATNAYAGSAACGECIRVDGPSGSVTVTVVDQCPDCQTDQVDLHPSAFDKIADRQLGRVDVSWQIVPCGLDGPIALYFKDGSNPYWVAIQVRNHRYPITNLEVDQDGEFVDLPRAEYNFFIAEQGLGSGPFTFRITDIHGSQILEKGIELGDNLSRMGTQQFPSCK